MQRHIIVVGGGLGGLAAAALAARSGHRVTLFERASVVGGRAITHDQDGYLLNQGPHALYNRGAAKRILGELGATLTGGVPAVAGGFAYHTGRLHTLPTGLVSLVTTGLLPLAAKLEAGRFLAGLPALDPSSVADRTVEEWLRGAIVHAEVVELVSAFIRFATYANHPTRQSAAAAMAQLQSAFAGNVTYVDGGWSSLVASLVDVATPLGVVLETGRRVAQVLHDRAVTGVRLEDGGVVAGDAIIVAVGPATARALLPRVDATLFSATPVRAACLDVALTALPRPAARFALGIDRPLYLSVHSAVARLAPPGGAVVHVARYLGSPDGGDGDSDCQAELEALLEMVQPGWRDHVATRRFLPAMIAANAVVEAGRRRPAVDAAGVTGLCLVGDWVGDEGMLADASLASARAAVERIDVTATGAAAA
jgi:phytoene dehydrogenase-like protein